MRHPARDLVYKIAFLSRPFILYVAIFEMIQKQKNGQERIEFNVPSHLLYIGPILAFARQLAQQLEFSQTRVAAIAHVLDEMCSNAIEHGSETSASGIDLTFIWDAGQLEILVRDKGPEKQANWLMTGRRDEVLQERTPDSERGHGIYLAQKLSDRLEMQPNSLGGTDVRVIFYRSSSV